MTRPMIRVHDLSTDEIVDREMNDKEFAEFEKRQAEIQTELEAEASKAAEKSAILAKLGITDDEAKLLLS